MDLDLQYENLDLDLDSGGKDLDLDLNFEDLTTSLTDVNIRGVVSALIFTLTRTRLDIVFVYFVSSLMTV